jgi:hypothetical protein
VSEGKRSFHSKGRNIRYDPVLVCRKQPSALSEANWDSFRGRIIRDSGAWTQPTLNSGMPVNWVVIAKKVEYVTKAFRNPAHRCGAIEIAALQEKQAQAACKAARLILF